MIPETTSPRGIQKSTFLTDLESDLSSLRNRIQDIGLRLQDAGFYGPPEEAATGQGPQPAENNTRSHILDEMRILAIHISRVEHQIGQLV